MEVAAAEARGKAQAEVERLHSEVRGRRGGRTQLCARQASSLPFLPFHRHSFGVAGLPLQCVRLRVHSKSGPTHARPPPFCHPFPFLFPCPFPSPSPSPCPSMPMTMPMPTLFTLPQHRTHPNPYSNPNPHPPTHPPIPPPPLQISAAEQRASAARADAQRADAGLRDYKGRAHALLKAKEMELQAVRNSVM